MIAGASLLGGTGLSVRVDGILLAQPEIRDAGCRYASTHLAGVTSGKVLILLGAQARVAT
jgi:hypothetical protein